MMRPALDSGHPEAIAHTGTQWPPGLLQAMGALASKCLQRDPEKRPTAAQVVALLDEAAAHAGVPTPSSNNAPAPALASPSHGFGAAHGARAAAPAGAPASAAWDASPSMDAARGAAEAPAAAGSGSEEVQLPAAADEDDAAPGRRLKRAARKAVAEAPQPKRARGAAKPGADAAPGMVDAKPIGVDKAEMLVRDVAQRAPADCRAACAALAAAAGLGGAAMADALLAANAVPVLARLLPTSDLPPGATAADTPAQAAAALGFMAGVPGHPPRPKVQTAAGAAGAVAALTVALGERGDAPSVFAAAMVAMLEAHPANAKRAMQAGALPRLVAAMRWADAGDAAASADGARGAAYAARALHSLVLAQPRALAEAGRCGAVRAAAALAVSRPPGAAAPGGAWAPALAGAHVLRLFASPSAAAGVTKAAVTEAAEALVALVERPSAPEEARDVAAAALGDAGPAACAAAFARRPAAVAQLLAATEAGRTAALTTIAALATACVANASNESTTAGERNAMRVQLLAGVSHVVAALRRSDPGRGRAAAALAALAATGGDALLAIGRAWASQPLAQLAVDASAPADARRAAAAALDALGRHPGLASEVARARVAADAESAA